MLSTIEFEQKFRDMAALCGFALSSASVETYYNAMKYSDEKVLFKAFEMMTLDPPSKLNLKHIKNFMLIARKEFGSDASLWDGTECSECIEGLVWHKGSDGNNYVFRCAACKSYDNNNYPYFVDEEIANLESKLKAIKENPGRMTFINSKSMM